VPRHGPKILVTFQAEQKSPRYSMICVEMVQSSMVKAVTLWAMGGLMLHNLASEPHRMPFLPSVLNTIARHIDCAVMFLLPFRASLDYNPLAGLDKRARVSQSGSCKQPCREDGEVKVESPTNIVALAWASVYWYKAVWSFNAMGLCKSRLNGEASRVCTKADIKTSTCQRIHSNIDKRGVYAP
jgi:hypothetical protein